MRTIEIKVYTFSELSETSKQKAIEDHRPTENAWAGVNVNSLKEFEKLFNSPDYDIQGQRLATWFWNNYKSELYKPKQYWICNGTPNCVGANAKYRNSKIFVSETQCPLTGYYMDSEILAPIYEFIRKPAKGTTFENLMHECRQAWEIACMKDFDFQCEDEQVIETIEANEYEFTEEGKLI